LFVALLCFALLCFALVSELAYSVHYRCS
jgi:hypothetical protein